MPWTYVTNKYLTSVVLPCSYKNVFDALFRVIREEGVLTLWRGCLPTIVRAIFVNAAQLATYSQAKQFLLSTSHFQDNIG